MPAYVVASWTNVIHVYGTFRAYCRLRGSKWLRVHDTIEWPDYYDSLHQTDLHRFFDRYLKVCRLSCVSDIVNFKLIDFWT